MQRAVAEIPIDKKDYYELFTDDNKSFANGANKAFLRILMKVGFREKTTRNPKRATFLQCTQSAASAKRAVDAKLIR